MKKRIILEIEEAEEEEAKECRLWAVKPEEANGPETGAIIVLLRINMDNTDGDRAIIGIDSAAVAVAEGSAATVKKKPYQFERT